MIPWLIVLQIVCVSVKKLSAIINHRINAYPVSGEINFNLAQPQTAIKKILTVYQNTALVVDNTDGISLEFSDWRFNLRMSNTEPLVTG